MQHFARKRRAAHFLLWHACLSGGLACSNDAADPKQQAPLVAGNAAVVAAPGANAPSAGTGIVVGPTAGAGTPISFASAGMGVAGSGAANAGRPAGANAQAGASGSLGRDAGAAGLPGSAGSVAGSGGGGAAANSSPMLERFSFFVTSLEGMQRASNSPDGFGGDLRYGQADGLSGADKICSDLAEHSMPGSSIKVWRAFLSAASGPDGKVVHAIDRVGGGPWYDRRGRIVAMTTTALLNTRPQGADSAIINDLPNEYGIPNHQPDPTQPPVDNHHVLTGSDTLGKLYQNDVNASCANWTSTAASAGKPRGGFSWIADGRVHWMSQFVEGGCGAKVSIIEMGGPSGEPTVGSGGGYGAIYCFALMP